MKLVEKDKIRTAVINRLEAENSELKWGFEVSQAKVTALKLENRRLRDIVKNLTDCL